MNQLTIIGNLTRAPESRTVGENTVCNFDVAVNRDYKRDGQPDADFFRVAAWGKTGENCQKYLDKDAKLRLLARYHAAPTKEKMERRKRQWKFTQTRWSFYLQRVNRHRTHNRFRTIRFWKYRQIKSHFDSLTQ